MNSFGKLPDINLKRALFSAGRPWHWVFLFFIFVFVVMIGPWPINWSHYMDSPYAQMTFSRIEQLPVEAQEGTIEAGVAVGEITPPVGEPLAGYSGRMPKESTGIKDKLFAKALTLKVQDKCVSIVSADILLFLPQIRSEILKRTNLAEEQVYFTSTHTHSGPGGYAKGAIEEFVIGAFSPKILDRLSQQVADVILESRKNLHGSRVCTGVLHHVPTWVHITRNRSDDTLRGFEEIEFLRVIPIDKNDKPLATLIIASPHATCLDNENRLVSGDYPTYLQTIVEKEFGGVCMFAAGAVGTMGPSVVAKDQSENANWIAKLICTRLRPVLSESPQNCQQKIALGSWVVPIDIPDAQFRFRYIDGLGISPFLASRLHGGQSYVHVLRVDDLLLLGVPSDFSGELAQQLSLGAKKQELQPVITSFNGDWIGYLITRKRFDEQNFESREENFAGPWGGEYFFDVLTRLHNRFSKASN